MAPRLRANRTAELRSEPLPHVSDVADDAVAK